MSLPLVKYALTNQDTVQLDIKKVKETKNSNQIFLSQNKL